jgi:hypothetical protein
MTARLRILSVVIGFASLCLGFGLGGEWLWAGIFLVTGIGGVIFLTWRKCEFGWVGLGIFLAAAAWGVYLSLPFWLMLLAALAGLAFWDLDALYARLRQVTPGPETIQLEKAHHRRLLLALLIGGLLTLVFSFFQIRLSLGWAIVIGLAVVLLIREGIRSLNLDGG